MKRDPGPNARRVLVVDDDEHTRNLLRDLCETSGFAVTMANDGVAAIERLQEAQPELLLLDLMMPSRDGFEVLKIVRSHDEWRQLPVIILTAMGDMDGKIRGMELGADDYVTKPFKLVELQTRISAALRVREYKERMTTAEEELSELRAVDPVTGAGTYSQLKASLDHELSRARRYSRPSAALLFGFDDYQNLRFQLGREGCDAFVGGMAKQIRDNLRGADHLFRMDVDEFILLLPETDLAGARMAAERLSEVVQRLSAEGRDGTFDVGVRIGGAAFPHARVQTSEDLLREANRSYRALRDTEDQRIFNATDLASEPPVTH